LWSANLFSLERDLCDLLGLLSGSCSVTLQRLLLRVAFQV
jgi:hypothetical protein